MKKHCPMCGTKDQPLTVRSYQYDNGQQYLAWVCPDCVDLHDRVTALKAKKLAERYVGG